MAVTVSRARYLQAGGQEAVALSPVDGEYISGTTQSNFIGDGFYDRNGFTRAATAGWDATDFMPIGAWLVDFVGTGFYDRMDDLGLNSMLPCYSSVTLSQALTRGKDCFVPGDLFAGGTIATADDPIVMGVMAGEEPFTVATYNQIISDKNTWMASADGPGRMSFINYTVHILNFDIEGTYFPSDMVTSADVVSCDEYWIAGSNGGSNDARDWLHFGMYQQPGSATNAQCARGSHYGSMMDCMRKEYPAGQVHPFWVWVENGAPYSESTTVHITPAQMAWAIWSTLVHGARIIGYFNHTFRATDPLASNNNFNDNGYGGPGITGTGMYAKAKETNLRALALASVINSPFDGYFVWGDLSAISTSGFLTAVTSTNSRGRYSGVDASCRWQPDEQKHYILATTREQSGTTNWPVTFRMVDQGQTTATEVHESNVITIERGGAIPGGFCEFDDTFATAESYKAYRID